LRGNIKKNYFILYIMHPLSASPPAGAASKLTKNSSFEKKEAITLETMDLLIGGFSFLDS
jgi:hypothetical protein